MTFSDWLKCDEIIFRSLFSICFIHTANLKRILSNRKMWDLFFWRSFLHKYSPVDKQASLLGGYIQAYIMTLYLVLLPGANFLHITVNKTLLDKILDTRQYSKIKGKIKVMHPYTSQMMFLLILNFLHLTIFVILPNILTVMVTTARSN